MAATLFPVHVIFVFLGGVERPGMGPNMMRTVYMSLQSLERSGPASRRNNPIWPEPGIIGSNSVAHCDPICSTLTFNVDAKIRALPAKLDSGRQRAVIDRSYGGFTINLCRQCRRYDAPPVDEQSWRRHALCSPENIPPCARWVSWMPLSVEASTGTQRRRNGRAALAVCRRCPVQSECLNYSLDAGMQYGSWGAMSQSQRTNHGVLAEYRREAG